MVFALMLPNFVAAAGITVIASILGIAGDIFGVSQGSAMWLMTGFMLTYTSFMPILGRLSDQLGRKKVFVTSIAIFTLGLLVSAITDNFSLVITGRLIQGIGAAGILPITNAFVSEQFPEKKGKYLAMVNATYGLGVIVGVNIGGITYDLLGWKWMFLIIFIASVISVVLAETLIKVPSQANREREPFKVDITGGLFFMLAIISFLLLVQNLSKYDFFSLQVTGFLLSLVVFATLFAVRELKIPNPAIQLRGFRKPGFLIYNLLALFFGIAMFIFTTFFPSYTQVLFGYSVSQSVYAIDPFALAMVVFIMLGGMIIKTFGARTSMIAGALLFAIGSFVFASFTNSELSYFLNSLLLAAGLGISMTPMNYIVIEEGGIENQGSSAGIVSIMRSLGGVIGPAFAGLMMSKIDFSSLFVMDSIIETYNRIFLMSFYSVLVMLFLGITGYIVNRKNRLELEVTK